MRATEFFAPTLREMPAEAEVVSHQLLLRAGFIRRTAAGVYTHLPLAQRVLKKIKQIIREEMDRQGGQEIYITQ
jgi:prolyl-tRNA synthetase